MPLSGIRVVDLTRILAGPFCTQLLADLGAEVIKVEPPGRGDPVRGQGAIKDGLSWYYAQFNRNKKSITLDLYTDDGKAVLADLIRRADVLVENFRPGVLDEMGFPAARLEALNPAPDPRQRQRLRQHRPARASAGVRLHRPGDERLHERERHARRAAARRPADRRPGGRPVRGARHHRGAGRARRHGPGSGRRASGSKRAW